MVSPTSQRSRNADNQISSQKGFISQKTGLALLSPELLMKIVSHARGSLVNFRLSCKQIDKTLAEASSRAFFDSRTLQLQTNNSTAPFVFPNLEKFSRLEEIAVELSGQAKERDLEQYSPRCKKEVGVNGYLPRFPKLTKIGFDQHIQPSDNLFYQIILNSLLRKDALLTTIDLQNCSNVSNEALVNMFKSLPQLQKIRLGRSNLTDPRDCHFELAQLKSLTLTESPYATDLFLERILKAAPQLEEFEISYCDQVTGQSFEQISTNLRTLTVLLNSSKYHKKETPKLDYNFLVNLIERNNELIKIDLSLPNESLSFNPSEKVSFNLKHLHLRQLVFNYIDANELILHTPNLEKLNIQNFYGNANDNFKLIGGMSNLKNLIVEEGAELNNSTLVSLMNKSSYLSEVTLNNCLKISSHFWEQVNFKYLTNFNLDDDASLATFTPKDFGNLARSALHLCDIKLSCYKREEQSVEDDSFENLEGTLLSLKHFDCYAFNEVGSDELLKIIRQAKKLEYVRLASMNEIRDICALQLLYSCHNLKKMVIDNCAKISCEMIDTLKELVELNNSLNCKIIRYSYI